MISKWTNIATCGRRNKSFICKCKAYSYSIHKKISYVSVFCFLFILKWYCKMSGITNWTAIELYLGNVHTSSVFNPPWNRDSGNTAELDSILVCKAETDISKQQTLIGFLDLSESFHDLAYPSHKRKWPWLWLLMNFI